MKKIGYFRVGVVSVNFVKFMKGYGKLEIHLIFRAT